MTKKTAKPPVSKVTHMRWSLGLFQSAHDGSTVVCYCKKDGTVSPYQRASVKSPKASRHLVYFGMTYAEARAKLLKFAGKKMTSSKSKKTATKEEHTGRKAA